MAFIEAWERRDIERIRLHDPISAKYAIHEIDGKRLIQIDTYGRKTREIPGKVSQTIQLDENSARELIRILSRTFNL